MRRPQRTIAGHSSDRYVYAPVAGVFVTACEIGMKVAAGQSIATIGDTVLQAPLAGRLRGLTHSEVEVAQGTKVIEIDPRDANADIYGIGERPRRIAAGVLAAITRCRGARRSRGGGVVAAQAGGGAARADKWRIEFC